MDYLRMIFDKRAVFIHIIIFAFAIVNVSFAGTIENVDGFVMYKTKSGEYAKSSWVWLDINVDSIKECYRFDEEGHIAANYVSNDGKITNNKGQLVENGFVMQKLSSGKVVKGEGAPEVAGAKIEGKVINNTGSRVLDNLPSEEIERDGNVILTTKLKDEVEIPIDDTVSTMSNIIYANGASGAISTINSDGSKSNNKIVAGKDIKNYITAKNNAKVDIEKAIVFGNEIWEDVIELCGNNSSIKINTKNFNYMYFEVAEENHVKDIERDELVELEVYADGELLETLDEFVEFEPQVEEIEELNAKVVELKVKITERNKNRRVYIRNGRLKKIREKDE